MTLLFGASTLPSTYNQEDETETDECTTTKSTINSSIFEFRFKQLLR